MKTDKFFGLFAGLVILSLVLSACQSFNLRRNLSPGSETPTAEQGSAISPESEPTAIPETMINFRVQIPENTPVGEAIILSVLDEVTGLYLNAKIYEMEEQPDGLGVYTLSLPFPVGSVVKYRYERQGDMLRVAEHQSNGNPVRYRMYVVDGPGDVSDVISRWTDTEYEWPSGRIMGQAREAGSEQPIPNLLISAGGAQTFSNSDGSFLIEGLPPGIHNLVGYSINGSYANFQQGAEIAPDSTTPATLDLTNTPTVKVTFNVVPPVGTPPLIPLRLAGNLNQLGNTFGTLSGGVSTLAAAMPTLTPQQDGSYSITLDLPVGADVQYKYTLGDGFWNAEHMADGSFKLRQLIVPDHDISVQDTIETWGTEKDKFLTFDITVPENTPVGDFVSIQFNPLFGWTEPIPMWNLGNNQWAYVLYSPLNLPGNLSYRYCRNSQCGTADDAATPGLFGAGRTVNLEQLPQQFTESVAAWIGIGESIDTSASASAPVTVRSPEFIAGLEFMPNYHPTWKALLPQALGTIQQADANTVVIDPTWSYTRINPPVLEMVAGKDPLWSDLVDIVQQIHSYSLKTALKPTPNFPGARPDDCITQPCSANVDAWWQAATRDYAWWQVWFAYYRQFLLHHADLANQTGAQALILGGDWLNPAMPFGVLADGSSSGVPADAEKLWRDIIDAVRQRYQGKVLWAIPYKDGTIVPPFLDAVDAVYLEYTQPQGSLEAPVSQVDLASTYATWLDNEVKPLQAEINKPFIIAFAAPSNPNLQLQLDSYQAMFEAIGSRDWVSGFVARGYYPPAALQDLSASIHGKPAEELLKHWFSGFAGNSP